MRKDKELNPGCMPVLKFWHTEGRKGYKCIEVCRSAKQYDTHCKTLGASEAGQEAMKLMELVKQTKGRVYGTQGELAASEFLPQYYPDIERIHGTPIDSAWGKPFHGWCD